MNAKWTLLAIVSLTALAACSDEPVTGVRERAPEVPLRAAAPGRGIDGSYIVALKPGSDPRAVARAVGAHPRHVYGVALSGFAGELTPGQLDALRHDPHVSYVEQDQTGSIATTQTSAPWNLDRIDQRGWSWIFRPASYAYNSTGAGVAAYVIDSGISTFDPQFGGRVNPFVGFTAFSDGAADCNGHGTHVAGTIGSKTYGVAKEVGLISVRVANCQGVVAYSDLVAGIEWVIQYHAPRSVANISLGGPVSTTVNDAVVRLVNSGVFVAVAAGNENQNACAYSPSSVVAATIVAASNVFDSKASFSNYGICVDLYAPGVDITSTSTVMGLSATMSGTSMAAPHVAGVAALYKATYGNAPQATIEAWLKSNATTNVITGNPATTPNLLLYKASL